MNDYYYDSYVGPLQHLYGRCAIVRPCKETYEEPDQKRMVVSQFDLPIQHPESRALLSQGWHRFEASDFQEVKPLPQ